MHRGQQLAVVQMLQDQIEFLATLVIAEHGRRRT